MPFIASVCSWPRAANGTVVPAMSRSRSNSSSHHPRIAFATPLHLSSSSTFHYAASATCGKTAPATTTTTTTSKVIGRTEFVSPLRRRHSARISRRTAPSICSTASVSETSSSPLSTSSSSSSSSTSSSSSSSSSRSPFSTSSSSLSDIAGRDTTPPLLRFAKLVCVHWRLLFPALFCAVVASVCAILEPVQFGKILAIISTINPSTLTTGTLSSLSDMRQRLLSQVLIIALTYSVELVCTAIFISFAARAGDLAIRRLRETVFEKTFANDVTFFDQVGRSSVERTTTLQLRIARQAFWDNLSEDRGLRAILEAIMGVGMCIKLVGPVGIPFFCAFIPLVSFLVAKLGMRAGRLNAKVEAKEADIVSFVTERLRGLTTVKAFGAERKEMENLSLKLDDAMVTSTEFVDTKAGTACANRVNIYVTIILFFICGGYLVSLGSMSFETFSSLVGFIWVLNFSMQGLLFTFTDAAKASVALRAVFDMVDRASIYRAKGLKRECAVAELPERFSGHIKFEAVSFTYPSRPDMSVLRAVSFDMLPGRTIALVGESGGGKSTIAALLCRFYEPTNGTVYMDGVDIACITPEVFSQQLSVVNQEPFLFNGTIRENIGYGVLKTKGEQVEMSEIIRAAKEANAHEFIMNLADGYDTVWNAGSNLSGGQRQRIAIARCLLKQPRILVLDEATSALDQESERAVQIAMEKMMRGRTTLIIAHRLSTIRSADVILVVKQGRIAERGTFKELYDMRGLFRGLVGSSAAVKAEEKEEEKEEEEVFVVDGKDDADGQGLVR